MDTWKSKIDGQVQFKDICSVTSYNLALKKLRQKIFLCSKRDIVYMYSKTVSCLFSS